MSTVEQPVDRQQSLIRMFVELADTLIDDFDMPDFLHRLLVHCISIVNAPSAGLLLRDARGAVQLVASSSERSADIEIFQLQGASGPCLDAIASGGPVRAVDLAAERGRWPMWSEVALAAGFRSVYATPMRLRTRTIGALNLFGCQPDVLDDDDLAAVQALADIATIGILQERAIRSKETLSRQLEAALSSRVVIEQAKGLIAGQSGPDLSTEQAFRMLRDYSRRTNTKLGVLCQDLLDGTLDVAQLTRPSPPRATRSASARGARAGLGTPADTSSR